MPRPDAAKLLLSFFRGVGRGSGRGVRGGRSNLESVSLPMLPVAGSMAAGIAAAAAVPWLTPPLAVVAAAVMLAAWWWAWSASRPAAGWLVAAAVAFTAAAWGGIRHDRFDVDDLAWRLSTDPQPVAVEAEVLEAPRSLRNIRRDPITDEPIRPAHELTVAIRRVRVGTTWQRAAGRAAVMVDGSPPQVELGSRLRIFGRGLRPASAGNPGEFDIRERARNLRCLSVIRCRFADCLEVIEEPPMWSPGRWIERLRRGGAAVLEAYIPRDARPLAEAILLGNREWLPREQTDRFLLTGTIHILSISGLHVGILAGIVFWLLRLLAVGRGASLAAVAAVTGLYMLLVRAEVPVVRATLVVWLACLAAASGRRPLGLNPLAVVAVAVLAWDPQSLFRMGTQLSFLATAVLVLLSSAAAGPVDPIRRLVERSRSPLERWLRRLARGLALTVAAGAAVWAVTAPLVAMHHHVVTPVAILFSPVVAPLLAAAMVCGFGCLVMACVSPALAGIAAAGCGGVLALIDRIVETAAALPGGHFWVAGPPGWWVAGWYLLLACLLAAPWWVSRQPAGWLAVAGGWCIVGGIAVAIASAWPRAGCELTVASLQHGSGIVLRTPAGRYIVYDAGRLGAPAAARRALAAVLWSDGCRHIDTLLLSHADADHFNAVEELLVRFSLGRLVVTPAFLASPADEARSLLADVRRRGIPLKVVTAGETLRFGPDCIARVLHPPPAIDPEADDNQTSLVLAVESAPRRVLLPGDIEGAAVDSLLAEGVPACDVMLAPHHGSRTSLPPRLAEAVRPRLVLVSGVVRGGWEEVRRSYEATGGRSPAVVATTGDGPAIRVRMNAAGIWLSRANGDGWSPGRRLEGPRVQAAAAPRAARRYRQPATASSSRLAARKAKNSVCPPWPKP